ncbi:MAG: hypothetical protein KDC35_18965 [Acidobacteria bacterium]|nr:hypothetical protein [Acidobacteriota bacterium]
MEGELVQFSPKSRLIPLSVDGRGGRIVEMVQVEELMYVLFDTEEKHLEMDPEMSPARITCRNGAVFNVLINKGAIEDAVGFFAINQQPQRYIYFFRRALQGVELNDGLKHEIVFSPAADDVDASLPNGTRAPVDVPVHTKAIWKGSELPGLVRMLRRELEARSSDGQQVDLDTLHRVNLISIVRAVIFELQGTKSIQLHINPAMGCKFGSIRYVLDHKTVWSLPLPELICREVMGTFKVLAHLNDHSSSEPHEIHWRVGQRVECVKVMAKPVEQGDSRLVVWIE